MLAQWISSASSEQFKQARNEPLITLGSAPLHVPSFRETVLAQLGEKRLITAIDADIAGQNARAKPLDADPKGALRDIHKRVGTAMLFESSGGMVDKVAHLPELRFALGEPDVETTTIDNAAAALEQSGFFVRRIGSDGYRIHHQATLRKAVADLPSVPGRRERSEACNQETGGKGVQQGERHPKGLFPEGQQRGLGRPPDDPSGDEPGPGMEGKQPHPGTDSRVDAEAGRFRQAPPSRSGLVYQETRQGPTRPGWDHGWPGRRSGAR